ncbi:unnamed protein product, partial [marine sediment metagenome]
AIVGGAGTVTAISGADGAVLWQSGVDGQARGLAVSDGRLLVSTSTGEIACFGSEQVADPPVIMAPVDRFPYPDDDLGRACGALAERIIEETGISEGYCLDFGAGDARLAYELARRSDLTIYCVEPDTEKVAAARRALDAAGLYGVRVTVHQAALDKLPYPDYFANLIVAGPDFTGPLSVQVARELWRVLRPHGGTAFLPSAGAAQTVLNLVQLGPVTVEGSAEGLKVVRGPLPGAGEWTHQYADAGKSGCSTDE